MNGVAIAAAPALAAGNSVDPLFGTGGDTLLIYAPVPLYLGPDDALMLEEQACNGLRLWAENFARLIVLMPLETGTVPANWVPLSRVGAGLDRIEICALPSAYRPDRFLSSLPEARRRIRGLIDRADYLSFAIGGLFGDWGAVACREAYAMGRPYAVWTDRVESRVVRQTMGNGPFRARLRARLIHRPMAMLERYVIRRAALGLFHGRETYEAYAPYCRQPQIVHDIHIARGDHIDPSALARKIADARSGKAIRICYAGRAEPMKGPLDWIEVLNGLAARSVDFTATWLGDGSQYTAMKDRVSRYGLADRVSLPGHVADRDTVLAALRDAHLFLFCHRTPESPRCLIEALTSGCPIVGYDGAFARDLVATHGGGRFAPIGETEALAEIIGGLAGDRTELGDLIPRAAKDGAPFDDMSVFRHRSMLIKEYL